MITCPLCEHAQAGRAECEVCGMRLDAPPAADPVAAPIPGLEPTRQAPVDAEGDPVPGLEPTRLPAGGVAPPQDPGLALALEPTCVAPVDVDAPPTPDLERTGTGIPGDARTPLPALTVCRYCRTPAMPGERLCGRCGMRLPVIAAPAGEGVPEARRCGCGALVTGPTCPACGARAPDASAG